MYPYGIIGNCHISALVSLEGSIDWLSLPRPDSPPIFGKILDKNGGEFSISMQGLSKSSQCYIKNTNILETVLESKDGSSLKITDFCPRFEQMGRTYRPLSLVRTITPLRGTPKVMVKCDPINGWEKERVLPLRGNSHLRFNIRREELRLTTNLPLLYLMEETPVSITEPLHFILTWGLPIEDDIAFVAKSFFEKTLEYWNKWVRRLSIPTEYQEETIRSALALKLQCYEETGAILAAATTSLPEEIGKERNWDYRYCWPRDAHFALSSFYNLGQFDEAEHFIKFLLGVVQSQEDGSEVIRPLYKLDQSLPTDEVELTNWEGYQGSKPVRYNNKASEQTQHDVYGEMVLSLAPIFFDERLYQLRTKETEALLSKLITTCIQKISLPDAGIWEYRNTWKDHTFSNLMSWTGIKMALKIKERGFLKGYKQDLEYAIKIAEKSIYAAVHEGVLLDSRKEGKIDASLLLLSACKFPDRDLILKTTEAIEKRLSINYEGNRGHLYRYRHQDDFGTPSNAFVICTFWLIQVHAQNGDLALAKELMEKALQMSNHLGLYSEHFNVSIKMQTGNFPQTYSHVGQINAAFALSQSWDRYL